MAILKLLRMLVTTRLARYTTAGVLLCLAGLGVWLAVSVQSIHQVRGPLTSLLDSRAQYKGAPPDTVTVEGDSGHYDLDPSAFSPPLSLRQLAPGAVVTLWVQDSPVNNPVVVALDIDGVPPHFVTDAYTHPEHEIRGYLTFTGVCFALALAALATAIWLPAPKSQAKQATRTPKDDDFSWLSPGAPSATPPGATR